MSPKRSVLARGVASAALVLLASAAPVGAHAELVATVPADGDTLFRPPDRIYATFNETLGPASALELRDQAGATIATGGIDAADGTTLLLDPPDLGDGTYEVRWTAVAKDGDITRGTFSFSVALPPTISPTPASTPAATPAATPAPATPSPTPAPSAVPSEPTGATGADVLIPILAAVVVLGALGAWLLRRRSGGA